MFRDQFILLGKAKDTCYERHYLPVEINAPWFECLDRIQLHMKPGWLLLVTFFLQITLVPLVQFGLNYCMTTVRDLFL